MTGRRRTFVSPTTMRKTNKGPIGLVSDDPSVTATMIVRLKEATKSRMFSLIVRRCSHGRTGFRAPPFSLIVPPFYRHVSRTSVNFRLFMRPECLSGV